MDEKRCNYYFNGDSEKIRKNGVKGKKKRSAECEEWESGKSILGKWLKELRGGHQREAKIRHPLGRTLSANAKDRDRKNKITRTLSANQKNGRDETFSPTRFRFNPRDEIDRTSLVSYLDEKGLEPIRGENRRGRQRFSSSQDDSMMPTSSALHSRRYENESSFVFRNEIYHRRQNSENYCSDDRSSRDRESSKSNYAFYSDAKEDVEPKYENVISKSAKEGREKKSGAINLEEEKCNYGEDRVGSEDVPDVPEAPVRDPSSLKFVKYGPGHEKFPSWPGSLPTESGEKPQRSHSWTERTAYPKEKVTSYARPHGKRPNPAFTQQLKTVMERCEKISPETYKKTMDRHVEERKGRIFLPGVDREGKSIGDEDYMVPSPPERDNPLLDQTDLAKYYSQNSTTKVKACPIFFIVQ